MLHSEALKANLRDSRVDVSLDPKYNPLLEITANYYGLQEGVRAFLIEVCHPYKNWRFIVGEARRLALQNFHHFKRHPQGPEGARLFINIFEEAIDQAGKEDARADAVDNLLVYLELVISESGPEWAVFYPVLNETFKRLNSWDEDKFFLLVRSFYELGALVRKMAENTGNGNVPASARALLHRYLVRCYDYWLGEPDPRVWFLEEAGVEDDGSWQEFFADISHEKLKAHRRRLSDLGPETGRDPEAELTELIGLPGFREIVNIYNDLPRRLLKAGQASGQGSQWQMIFLFHSMNLMGLAAVHERVLRDINRTLTRLIGKETPDRVRSLVFKTFDILTGSWQRFPGAALNCLLNMGQAVYRTEKLDMVGDFIDSVIGLGFQTPNLSGVGEDWQIRANEAHVQNIRVWMELAGLSPARSKKLLGPLIVHLALSGIFIKDTDLFPRDITALLSADIGPAYNTVKQLCRLFPAYFNEIGAEGRLREVSTQIDELAMRRDVLVHYLRKQSHVESSPQTVILIEAIFEFWRTLDRKPLADLVPPDIYTGIDVDGPFVSGLHNLMTGLFESGVIKTVQGLLKHPEGGLAEYLAGLDRGVTDHDRQRFTAAHSLYLRLYHKYHTDRQDLLDYVAALQPRHYPDLHKLIKALKEADPFLKLEGLLEYLEILKGVILSSEKFEIEEDIYYKRHIAVDIPSMYGSYHEPRFDALGLSLRLESMANTLFQEIIDGLDLKLITRAAFVRILDILRLFDRALRLDGIASREITRQIELLSYSLNVRWFSFTQYLDIFRGFSQAVSNLVNDYFNNVYHGQLLEILEQITADRLLPKYRPASGGPGLDQGDLALRVSEIFLRDRIAGSLGLQQLDQFAARILKTVFQQDHQLSADQLRRLLNYDPDLAVTPLDPVREKVSDIIHLGAKGYNLVRVKALGLPVPPGFILTTEIFRCRSVIDSYEPAREHFRDLLQKKLGRLEKLTGRRFGDPDNPLLLSVRSGSSISQPGMLSTFLNVGLNEEIVRGMAAGPGGREWFAWDCFRRYLQSMGMSHGLKRDDFDALINETKDKYGVEFKRNLSGSQMKEAALAYQELVRSHHLVQETRPFEQLYLAVKGVFDSWESAKARTYREIMGISNDWGTAVTVQSMVFGNLSDRAGSGVVFTHNPRWSEGGLSLWGDFTLGNQGEDVVSGLVRTLPISQTQAEVENRTDFITLESYFPEIYRRIYDLGKDMIYRWGYGPQEIEFTFEGPQKDDLYILQTRDMVLRERRDISDLDPADLPSTALLGHGIGVSGRVMAGRLVFTLEEINGWRKTEPDTRLILVRGDTVPDDIREINAADGLLTARGGSTSHAAIVAYRLKKTCIVGCTDLITHEAEKKCRLGGEDMESGDFVTIDGFKGLVFKGRFERD